MIKRILPLVLVGYLALAGAAHAAATFPLTWSIKPHIATMVTINGTFSGTQVSSDNTAAAVVEPCASGKGFMIQSNHLPLNVTGLQSDGLLADGTPNYYVSANITWTDTDGSHTIALHVEVYAPDGFLNIYNYYGIGAAAATEDFYDRLVASNDNHPIRSEYVA